LYVGSNNVSENSKRIPEAILKTNHIKTIKKAIKFINYYKGIEMIPEQLNKLQEIYNTKPEKKPPKSAIKPLDNLSKYYIYKVEWYDYTNDEKKYSTVGLKKVNNIREPRYGFRVDEFMWAGRNIPNVGDIVFQIMKENNKYFIYPAGRMIHTQSFKEANKLKTFCYLEVPTAYRRNIKKVKNKFTNKELNLLRGNRNYINNNFARKIISNWSINI